jgi:type I restriction enzyme S subunit
VVIPDGWQEVRLGDLGEFSKGSGIKKDDVIDAGVPCIRYGQIYTEHHDVVRKVRTFVSQEVASNSHYLTVGDVLFAGSGETKAEIGKCVAYVEDVGAVAGGDIVILSPSDADSRFLGYALNASWVSSQKMSRAQGDAVVHISAANLSSILVPIPRMRKEQQAIAEALSDADALVESLDALIAKKRDMKQAAMQQLLTGRTRLPGFTDKWQTRQFAELCSPRSSRIDPRVSGGGDFCVELEHLESGTARLLGSGLTTEVSSLKTKFAEGDVLFGKLRSYLRKSWLADRSGVCSTEIWVLAASPDVSSPRFLAQVVQTDRFVEASSMSYGTHMPRSDWSIVSKHELAVASLPEQEAIGTVLMDMDAEIDALVAQREKAELVKQGMMQELLSGRVRLA